MKTEEKDQFVCSIISLIPRRIKRDCPGMVPPDYVIPESDGTIPVIFELGTAYHFVYLDGDRGSIRVANSPDIMARSIVRDVINAQVGVSPDSEGRPGIFWIPGSTTPGEVMIRQKDRLIEEKRLQHIWLTDLCKGADNDWNRYRIHSVVSDFQRKAARMLGWSSVQHEWMTTELAAMPVICPACATPVPSNVIVCPTCRCVLNVEEYKKLTFAQ